MRARFGRDIYCQVCGKDDKITIDGIWKLDGTSRKFGYIYRCNRCRVKVKEIDRSKFGVKDMVDREITFEKCECENDTFKIRVTPYGECGSDTEWFCAKCGKSPGGFFNDPLKEIPQEIYGRR